VYGVRDVKRRQIDRFRHPDAGHLLLSMLGIFAVGCVFGTLAGLLWPDGLDRSSLWELRLSGGRVPFGVLLLRSLRVTVLLCICASSGRFRALVWPVICLLGLQMAYEVSCLLQMHGAAGVWMAVSGQFFVVMLQLPLQFYLALRSSVQRRPLPMDGALLRLVVGILLYCALCAALDVWISPLFFSLLR